VVVLFEVMTDCFILCSWSYGSLLTVLQSYDAKRCRDSELRDARWSQLNVDGRGDTMLDGPRLTTTDAEVDAGGSSDPQTGTAAAAASIPSHWGRCRPACTPDDLTQYSRVQ